MPYALPSSRHTSARRRRLRSIGSVVCASSGSISFSIAATSASRALRELFIRKPLHEKADVRRARQHRVTCLGELSARGVSTINLPASRVVSQRTTRDTPDVWGGGWHELS